MPVSVLWVEGRLDAEVLNQILGRPNFSIRAGGSRSLLLKQVQWARKKKEAGAFYLCDRDFHEPPVDSSAPIEEKDCGQLMGWHWCRHDIESYLLEPNLVAAAVKKDRPTVEVSLRQAAEELQSFVAARWVVGSLRPKLQLETMPDLGDYALPAKLDRPTQETWCRTQVLEFRQKTESALSAERLDQEVHRWFTLFESAALDSIQSILSWFPGKNLLPAVARKLGLAGAGDLIPKLTSRLAKQPQLLADLPEIEALRQKLSNL